EVMNDVLLKTNENFQIEIVRGAIVPILGYSEKELVGRTLLDLVEEKEYLLAYRGFVLRGKMKECAVDVRAARKGGGSLWMSFSLVPVFVGTEVDGFTVVAADISNRKRAEEQIRLLAQALQSSQDLISITDTDDHFIFVNRSFLTAYGLTEQEVIGKHPSM